MDSCVDLSTSVVHSHSKEERDVAVKFIIAKKKNLLTLVLDGRQRQSFKACSVASGSKLIERY